MKIVNKKKFIVRIIEILIIIATIILTIISIDYATKMRGYDAFGVEYLIFYLILLHFLDYLKRYTIYSLFYLKKKRLHKKARSILV